MHTDKSFMFEDFNFKLVVINSLLGKQTSFSDELKKVKAQYLDSLDPVQSDYYYNFECIPEIVSFFEDLCLTSEDLSLVTELTFDGGNDIYGIIMPSWDGESEEFDVMSVKGFEKLINLKKVIYVSMCDEELMKAFSEKGIEV